jgi:hypothetical protein
VETRISPISPNPPPFDGSSVEPREYNCWLSVTTVGPFICRDERVPEGTLDGRDIEKAFDARREVVAIRARLMAMIILFFLMDVHPFFSFLLSRVIYKSIILLILYNLLFFSV